jgi:sugar O-acyltransferase (sialic acid O-acetyltransferase NeuD family)
MKQALIGAGGHAQEVRAHVGSFTMKCFVDDEYWRENNNHILPLSQFDPTEYEVMIAIANPQSRYEMSTKLPGNTKYFSYIHPSAQILSPVSIGHGSFIGANCVLTCNIQIGNHAILNRAVHIGHDCIIRDYFSAMPGVIISGDVKIQDKVYIGNNASVKEKTIINESITIGSNATVVKDLIESGTYVGVPVKKIK